MKKTITRINTVKNINGRTFIHPLLYYGKIFNELSDNVINELEAPCSSVNIDRHVV